MSVRLVCLFIYSMVCSDSVYNNTPDRRANTVASVTKRAFKVKKKANQGSSCS